MPAVHCLLSNEELLCSICQGTFTDPVSTPCGHNFCKRCITEHWKIDVPCQCPKCKRAFYPIPELRVNVLIAEVTARIREAAQQNANAATPAVSCHSCTAARLSVLTPFLVCLMCVGVLLGSTPQTEGHAGNSLAPSETTVEAQQLMREIERAAVLSGEAAARELAEGAQAFAALAASVQRAQAKLTHAIEERKRTTEERELQRGTRQLKKRGPEAEQFSVARLERALGDAAATNLPVMIELMRAKQHTVHVQPDPRTVYSCQVPSDDGHKDRTSKGCLQSQVLPVPCALALQSFSSGRFYYEVQVKGRDLWELGLIRQSVNREEFIVMSPKEGYWAVGLHKEKYYAVAQSKVELTLKWRPEKLGVFLDYENGLVSFYDADAAAVIHSFTGCPFLEKLHPYFGPTAASSK